MAKKLTEKEHITIMTSLVKQLRDNLRDGHMSDQPTETLEALVKKIKYFRTKFKTARRH